MRTQQPSVHLFCHHPQDGWEAQSHTTPESLPTKTRAPLDSLDISEWEESLGVHFPGMMETNVYREVSLSTIY